MAAPKSGADRPRYRPLIPPPIPPLAPSRPWEDWEMDCRKQSQGPEYKKGGVVGWD